MKTIVRSINATLVALLAALPLATAAAGLDPAVASRQAEYFRLHNTAVAFADTVGKSADRYSGLRAVDMNQVRQLIAQSEEAAQRQDFDSASTRARAAYELLRTAITTAVAQSGNPGAR